MVKFFFLFMIFFMLNNCSSEKKIFFPKKNLKNKEISKLNFDYNLTFDEFKNNVIEYGKLSDFPKLDN